MVGRRGRPRCPLGAGVKVYEIMRDDDRLFARAVDGRPRKTEDS